MICFSSHEDIFYTLRFYLWKFMKDHPTQAEQIFTAAGQNVANTSYYPKKNIHSW